MQKWLGRLAFSLIVIAAVVAWEGGRAARRGRSPTRHYVAAAVFGAAGIIGLRERHRR